MQKISDQLEFYPTHRSVPLATAENWKYNETVLEYTKWCFFKLTSSVVNNKNLSHYWINIKMCASSKHNSDALVFRNRNMGQFSIGCFFMNGRFRVISLLFVFVKIHNSILYMFFAAENARNTFGKIQSQNLA